MKRIVITLAVAALAVGGFAAGSSASSTASRKPASNPVIREAHTRLGQLADRLAKLRVRCRTLSCVNKSLTRLANGLKNLSNELATCELLANVSQYSDYAAVGNPSQPVSGLDYTDPNVPGNNPPGPRNFLFWNCAVT